jgi:hypothetical protein
MSKATAVLFISFGLVLCTAASGLVQVPRFARLDITGGNILVNEVASWRPSLSLIGANFRIDGGAVEACCPSVEGILGISFGAYYFVVDGVTYADTSCCPPTNGRLVLFPVAFTTPTPVDIPRYAGPYSTPFRMSGHIGLGPGFNVVGRGIFTVGRDDSGIFFRWDFLRAEP